MLKKSSNKFKKEKPKDLANLDKTQLAAFHSGVMGLCAIVEAYPYDVPEMVPDILIGKSNYQFKISPLGGLC